MTYYNFAVYQLITYAGCFALLLWVLPKGKLSNWDNLRGTLVLSLFGIVIWPFVLYASIKHMYFTKNKRS